MELEKERQTTGVDAKSADTETFSTNFTGERCLFLFHIFA